MDWSEEGVAFAVPMSCRKTKQKTEDINSKIGT